MENVKTVEFRQNFKDVDETLKEIKDAVEDGTLRNLITIMRLKEKDGQISIGWNWMGKDTFVTYIGLIDCVKMSMHERELGSFEEVED